MPSIANQTKKKTIPRCLRITCQRLAKNDPTLTVFMTDKAIQADGIQALGSTLKTNTHLKWIYLEGTNLGSCLIDFVEALRGNTSVENLYLYSNQIDDEGAAALAGLLRDGPPLKVLALYGNKIGSDGVKVLVEELQSSRIERLDLRDNEIGTEGALAFSQLLRKSSSLKSLFLEGNEFSKEAKLELVKSVEQNYFLQHFGMDHEEGCEMQEKIKFYLRLNRSGRRLLQADNCPTVLWAHLLEKLEPDLVHYYLKSNPRLFMTKQEEQQRRGPRRSTRKRICYRESSLSNNCKRAKTTSTNNQICTALIPSAGLGAFADNNWTSTQAAVVPQDTFTDSSQPLRFTLTRSTSMSWGVWLCNRGGMCLVSRAVTSMPGNSQLRAGDAILVAKAKPFATDIDQDNKDTYKNVVRLFRTSYTIHVAVKRAPQTHLTIRRRERESWGVMLEGNAGICIVAGARNKKNGLHCGDLIWSAMDESKQTHIIVPSSGKNWYQRMLELFETSTVLHLVIGRLGSHVEAQPKVVVL